MTKKEVQPSKDALQQVLDAVEILQMTLEDTVFNHRKRDLLSTLQEVEMCYRFLEDVFWPDNSGVIRKVLSNLTKIQVSLLSNTSRLDETLNCHQWNDLMKAMISEELFEDMKTFPIRLRERDLLTLKCLIADRISEFMMSGPLEFKVESTLQLLERIELCLRYLKEDDMDYRRLSVTSSDIYHLVSLTDSYEVMEYWENIDFEGWFDKTSPIGSLQHVKVRKVYESAEIFREKLRFEDRWRDIFKSTDRNFVPPKMMASYPDHPYSTYFKKNQNRFTCYINFYNHRSPHKVVKDNLDSQIDGGSNSDVISKDGSDTETSIEDPSSQKEHSESSLAPEEDPERAKIKIGSRTHGGTMSNSPSTDSLSSDLSSETSISFTTPPVIVDQYSSCYLTPPHSSETDLVYPLDQTEETSYSPAPANLTINIRKRRKSRQWSRSFNEETCSEGKQSGGKRNKKKQIRQQKIKTKQIKAQRNRKKQIRAQQYKKKRRRPEKYRRKLESRVEPGTKEDMDGILEGAYRSWCAAWWNHAAHSSDY